MRVSTFFGIGAGLLSAVLPALGEQHGRAGRRHQDVAKRAPGHVQAFKRGSEHSNARFSFYATGLGACGKVNNDNDFIVAQNVAEFGSGYPGPNCFKMITITYGGKTTQAQITDACPGCPYGGLDMSPGLFKFFADESVGIIYGKWWYSDDTPEPTTSKYTPPATPTSTWKPDPTTSTSKYTPPPPTTTWTPEPTTSTSKWVPPTTSSSSTPPPEPTTTSSTRSAEPSSSSARSTSQAHSSSEAPSSAPASEASVSATGSATASSASATATDLVSNDSTGNALNALNQAILGMGGVAIAGAKA